MRAETGVTSIFAGDETPSDTRSADGSRTRTEDDQIPSAGRELHVDQGLVLDVRQQATVTQPVEPRRHTLGLSALMGRLKLDPKLEGSQGASAHVKSLVSRTHTYTYALLCTLRQCSSFP